MNKRKPYTVADETNIYFFFLFEKSGDIAIELSVGRLSISNLWKVRETIERECQKDKNVNKKL